MVEKTGVLANAPLVFVLTAIKFMPLEALPNWIPDIQEALRDRFPVFSRLRQAQTPQGFEVSIDSPDFSPEHPGSAWLFTNAERTITVQLSKSALVMHTTAYLRFADFASDLRFAFDVLLSKARLLNVESAGIRYIDHIQPKGNRSLADYVPKELLPFDWHGHARVVGGTSVNSYRIGTDLLQVKFRTGQEFNILPEDLAPAYFSGRDLSKLTSAPPLMEKLGPSGATLDTDVSAELSGKRMGASEVIESVDRLHGIANLFFREACAEAAFADWQEESQT